MSIPDQSIECQNPNCGYCSNTELEAETPVRPFTCRCGHTRPNHQPADQWSPETCTLCSMCSRPSREHYGGGGHSYQACQCWRPEATESDAIGSGVHRTTETGEAP